MSFPSQFSTDGLAELRALGTIIQDSIARIDSAVTAERLEFPSSATPFTPESELARSLPAVAEATSYLVAAAFQTIHLVRAPPLTILTIVEQHTLSACLGIAARANAAEVCREKGPQGADVRDIAVVTGVDSSKLARVLRLLATYHIFLEVTPNVFANNRISSLLDTGKPVHELIENPAEKFIGAAGLAAGIGHCTDEFMKAAAYFEDALFHPEIGKSDEPGASGLTLAFPNEPFSSIFEWLELKGNEKRFHRFGAAMESSQRTAPPGHTLSGFDWAGLPKDSLIVDVGGGIGAQSMTLAKACPHLRFIIQDRAPVMEDFKTFWQVEAPEVLSSGRVAFSVHNFFDPQPVGDAAVFLMRMILHDWPEKYCIKILRNLRAAANPSTRLVIIDNVVPYACADDDPIPVPGVNRPAPPAPLLANLGYANAAPYLSDVMMMSMFNAKERSLSQFRDLFEQCGWNLVETHQVGPHNFNVQKMIGVPAAPAVPAAA